MSLYRGAGGAGDAVADSASEALLVRELAIEVQADADAAAASATAAAGSASGASTSATNASNSASAAATSATNAANSASTATTQASNAATSATAAQTAETAAELAETNAETAQAAAASSASAASSSASAASTSATNASNSATAAATSATNSANSATASATSATNSANSATAAAGSATTASTQATNASNSATAAASSATAAAGSATSASGSASTATTQAGIATTQAGLAATSASNAATSETNAAASASTATTQAGNAATSATNASNSASAASTSATNAANSATAAAASAASINPASIAITGGSINGTTIGASTPSTGAFTTLGASGVATFSAGTVSAPAITTTGDTNTGIFFPAADTIAFTEGGVESMRIDASGNIGLGSTPKAWSTIKSIDMLGGGASETASFASGFGSTYVVNNAYYNGTSWIANTTSVPTYYSQISGTHQWHTGTSVTAGTATSFSERMRIDSSGNVGIGVTSLSYKLQLLAATGTWLSFTDGTTQTLRIGNTTQGLFYNNANGGYHSWQSAGSEQMRIDGSTGNVGIGTSSPATRLSVTYADNAFNAGITLTNSTNNTQAQSKINIVNSSGDILALIQNSASVSSGVGFVGTSGTQALTLGTGYAERMRIDSSGNVGIGTSSISRKFEVHGAPVSIGGSATGMLVSIVNNTTAFNSSPTSGMSFFTRFNTAGGTFPSCAIQGGKENATDGNYAGFMSFFTTNGSADVNEQMRITSAGNVGIGTSSPVTGLSVNKSSGFIQLTDGTIDYRSFVWTGNSAAAIGTWSNHALLFNTNNTERMRIDSSGNLLVGTTAPGTNQTSVFKLTTVNSWPLTTDGNNRGLLVVQSASSGIAAYFVTSTSTVAGYIDISGSTTSYVTSSDYRLKENIAPMTGALAKVSQLKPVSYTWKNTKNEQGEGFIAHELAEVCPLAVCGEKDAVDEEGNIKPQGIDTSFLVATLTAAIQELKAELDSVKAELQTLKGN